MKQEVIRHLYCVCGTSLVPTIHSTSWRWKVTFCLSVPTHIKQLRRNGSRRYAIRFWTPEEIGSECRTLSLQFWMVKFRMMASLVFKIGTANNDKSRRQVIRNFDWLTTSRNIYDRYKHNITSAKNMNVHLFMDQVFLFLWSGQREKDPEVEVFDVSVVQTSQQPCVFINKGFFVMNLYVNGKLFSLSGFVMSSRRKYLSQAKYEEQLRSQMNYPLSGISNVHTIFHDETSLRFCSQSCSQYLEPSPQ